MKAKKTKRPLAEIQAEYERLCKEVGEREYKRRMLEVELAALCRRMLDLNEEAARAKSGG